MVKRSILSSILFARSRLAAHLLSIPYVSGTDPGLILVQVDGLAKKQFEKGLEDGKLPFVSTLLSGSGYKLHSVYSGLPSSTPAFQGELFYGHKCAVPAFGFRHRKTGEMFHMLHERSVLPIQAELSRRNIGLLKGGSAYVDIYTGDAQRSSFCVTSLGLFKNVKKVLHIKFLFIAFLYGFLFLRMSALFFVELLLAFSDLIRGLIARQNFLKEINFIPARVGICVLLRELVTVGVSLDIARNFRIIHCNFLGYDEQSHRRGPSSRFAHWTLKGIDDSIRRIFLAAQKGNRKYEIWIYSDHGQESALSYSELHGSTVHQSVSNILKGAPDHFTQHEQGVQNQRVSLLGSRFFTSLFGLTRLRKNGIEVAAVGPIAHIYMKEKPSFAFLNVHASKFVTEAGIPIVLIVNDSGAVVAWTKKGRFILPKDIASVVGADHPFLNEVGHDLAALVKHPDAGHFVFSGWRIDDVPLSFPIESGAHAGPGRNETHAFAVLPRSFNTAGKRYFRAMDLRNSAVEYLKKIDRKK